MWAARGQINPHVIDIFFPDVDIVKRIKIVMQLMMGSTALCEQSGGIIGPKYGAPKTCGSL